MKKSTKYILAGVSLMAVFGVISGLSEDRKPQEQSVSAQEEAAQAEAAAAESNELDLFLSITPGMNEEGVLQALGEPHERRIAQGSGQYWMYGADTNMAVIFLQGQVMLANTDVRGMNAMEARSVKATEVPERCLKLTPGMTPEMVLRDAGKPNEVRDQGGSGEMWMYGPNNDLAVTFLQGTVVLVNWSVREMNRMQHNAMKQYAQ